MHDRLYYGLPGGYDLWRSTEPREEERDDYDPDEDFEREDEDGRTN